MLSPTPEFTEAAAAPPVEVHLNINAAFALGGRDAGTSGQFIKFIGVAPTLDACVLAAAVWRNASAPASERCLSAAWYRAPTNASFAQQCYCLVNPKWIPVGAPGVDSARLLWPCSDDGDCSFNGACSPSGVCACDAAWEGPRCGALRLGPVDARAPGYRGVDARGSNVSTWGAPMLYDAAGGLWHAWASEMLDGCGINAWRTNSHVIHATAPAPGGPWTRLEEVWPAFAHEPDVVRGPRGEWVMVWSAFELPNAASDRCTNCTSGSTSPVQPNNPVYHKGGCGPLYIHPFKQMISTAGAPGGPWSTPVEITALSRPWDWNTALTIARDGSAVALVRSGIVWAAQNYTDPASWALAAGGAPLPDGDNTEDPHIYMDAHGRYHALFHAMDPNDDPAFCGAHAFSIDGVAWTYSGWAYGNNATYTDGEVHTFSRRERPHMLFAPDGTTPLALSTGVQYAGGYGDAVFTLVQPIAASA